MQVISSHIIAIEPSELAEALGIKTSTVSDNIGKNRNHFSQIRTIPKPNNPRAYLYDYESLTEAQKQALTQKFGDVRQLLISNEVKVSTERVKQYALLGYSSEKAQGFARKLAWLEFLTDVKPSDVRQKFGLSKQELLEAAVRLINQEQNPSFSISSVQYLKTQILVNFRKVRNNPEKLDSLVLDKRKGLQNAKKLTQKAERLVFALYSNANEKLLLEQAHRLYMQVVEGQRRFVCQSTGEVFEGPSKDLPSVCSKTLYNLTEGKLENKIIMSALRNGGKYHNDKYRPYVIGQKPTAGLVLTSSDGETCPFLLRIGGKETYKRATCYLIFDVYSGAIVGWALGASETTELALQAFGNMLRFTGGYAPLQNQLDNFGKGVETVLKPISTLLSFGKPYSPQSKYAERLIGLFENEQLRKVKGWVGANIQSKKQSSKRNPDVAHTHYTIQEVQQIYAQAISEWNAERAKKALTHIHQDCKQVDKQIQASVFGNETFVTVNRGFLYLQINNEKLVYDLKNYHELLSKIENGGKVKVKWLDGELDKVYVFNYGPQGDVFLCEAAQAQRMQRAKSEQTEEDLKILGRHLKKISKFDERITERISDIPELIELTNEEAEVIQNSGYTSKSAMVVSESVLYGGDSISLYEDDENLGKEVA